MDKYIVKTQRALLKLFDKKRGNSPFSISATCQKRVYIVYERENWDKRVGKKKKP